MKLASFFEGTSARLGLVEGDEIVDIASAGGGLPASVQEVLSAGEAGMQAVGRAARVARNGHGGSARVDPGRAARL